MTGKRRQNGETGYQPGGPPKFIRVSPAYLTVFVALNGFAVAAVVLVASLAIHFAVIGWKAPAQESPAPCPHPTPPFLQIQVLGDGGHSAREVVVDPEKNSWVGDVISALQQIQVKGNDVSSASNVVLDPEQNTWIDRLIDAMSEAGKSQCAAPVAGVNPNGDGGNKSSAPAGNPTAADRPDHSKHEAKVVVDVDSPPWVGELLKAIHGAVEYYAIDRAILTEVKGHLKCNEDERLFISGIIRFPGGEYSLDDAAKDRMDSFATRVGGQAGKWGIFGFASVERGDEMNRKLSWQRACAVKKYICEKNSRSQCEAGCKTYPGNKEKAGSQCIGASGNPAKGFLTCFLGEEHFINGVADSRSVVMAACKGERAAQNVEARGQAPTGNQ